MGQTHSDSAAPGNDDAFVRSAGRHLLIYSVVAVIAAAALMVLLNTLAGLVGSVSGDTAAVEPQQRLITIAIRDEPPQLDSGQRADQISGMVLGHLMEGLLIRDADSKLVGGVAR